MADQARNLRAVTEATNARTRELEREFYHVDQLIEDLDGARAEQSVPDTAKKQQTVAIHAATTPSTPAPLKHYARNLPKCNKCNYHHTGACREMHCRNCEQKGHIVHLCKAPARPISQVANAGASQTCYGCGEAGHFKRNCPKARAPNTGAVGRVLAIGHGEEVKDPMVVTGTFLLNNSYACVLFDIRAERSFVSHQFKRLLKQKPQSLNDPYIVEMANEKVECTNDIYTGCTLTLDNHSFQIGLMPVIIKSFDIIIGMDWLSSNRADILCCKRAIRLNLPNGETFLIYGDKPNTNLQIISCVKAQKYLQKEYHAFLAHMIDKKQEAKDTKDIPEVCNFPNMFP
ncbi:uncharacterized protein LOC128132272 [Lactuca sativa]|uniref:uncharacterized protein LOC128132272 n=1 Tax=Lactuca sativa TaxID=4236 RepID=UPI0022AEB5E9|nr:uncharacterized protein LOC128132272 [Lactuca sativa]